MSANRPAGSDPGAPAASAVAHPQLSLPGLSDALRQAFIRCHGVDANLTKDSFQNTVEIRTLIELLIAKGVIGLTEFEARRHSVVEQVSKERAEAWTGPQLYPIDPNAPPGPPVHVDCAARLDRCGAACCSLFNVYLSVLEIHEGRILWDLERPFRLLRGEYGHCVYLDPETLRCRTWENRPLVCQQFTCAGDARIWRDFDARLATDDVARQIGYNEILFRQLPGRAATTESSEKGEGKP